MYYIKDKSNPSCELVKRSELEEVLKFAHCGFEGSHRGINKSQDQAKRFYYWKTMIKKHYKKSLLASFVKFSKFSFYSDLVKLGTV